MVIAMIRPFLLFVAAGLLLGCGGAEVEEPGAELQATGMSRTTEPKPLVVPQGAGLRDLLVPFAGSAALMRRLREKKLVE